MAFDTPNLALNAVENGYSVRKVWDAAAGRYSWALFTAAAKTVVDHVADDAARAAYDLTGLEANASIIQDDTGDTYTFDGTALVLNGTPPEFNRGNALPDPGVTSVDVFIVENTLDAVTEPDGVYARVDGSWVALT